jgi:hypothetical protein
MHASVLMACKMMIGRLVEIARMKGWQVMERPGERKGFKEIFGCRDERREANRSG